MPSRLTSGYQDLVFRFRHSPLAIAVTAGAIGLISGALFVAVFAKPSADVSAAVRKQPVETTGASATKTDVVAARPENPQISETQASATQAKQANADADCEQQAWPYITPKCQAEREAGQRKVRVITTDRIAAPVVSAIETAQPLRAKTEDKVAVQAAAPSIPAATPPMTPVEAAPAAVAAPAPAIAAPAPQVASAPVEASAPVDEKPEIVLPAATRDVTPPADLAPATKQERTATKDERRKAAQDKRKRDAKARKAPAAEDDDDDENASRSATASRGDTRQGRIVERWTERVYDVQSEDEPRRSRTVVVRRAGEGDSTENRPRSIFSLFGN